MISKNANPMTTYLPTLAHKSSNPKLNTQSANVKKSVANPTNAKIIAQNPHTIIMSVYRLPLITLLFFLHVLPIAMLETLHLLSVTVKVLISLSA